MCLNVGGAGVITNILVVSFLRKSESERTSAPLKRTIMGKSCIKAKLLPAFLKTDHVCKTLLKKLTHLLAVAKVLQCDSVCTCIMKRTKDLHNKYGKQGLTDVMIVQRDVHT